MTEHTMNRGARHELDQQRVKEARAEQTEKAREEQKERRRQDIAHAKATGRVVRKRPRFQVGVLLVLALAGCEPPTVPPKSLIVPHDGAIVPAHAVQAHPTCETTVQTGDFPNARLTWRIVDDAPWIQRGRSPGWAHPQEFLNIGAVDTVTVQICSEVPVYVAWATDPLFHHTEPAASVRQRPNVWSTTFEVGYAAEDSVRRRWHAPQAMFDVYEDGGLWDHLEEVHFHTEQEPHRVTIGDWRGRRPVRGQPRDPNLYSTLTVVDERGRPWAGHLSIIRNQNMDVHPHRLRIDGAKHKRLTWGEHWCEKAIPGLLTTEYCMHKAYVDSAGAEWEGVRAHDQPGRWRVKRLMLDGAPLVWYDPEARRHGHNIPAPTSLLCLHRFGYDGEDHNEAARACVGREDGVMRVDVKPPPIYR